ncbi:serine hydrolase [Larkinella sp. VNQ87]|uniref:serine hydrolase n=1 Tax=Larkinella sp. VNQ87 TaxID=3400921 RepID=UPI003C050B40
MAFPQKLFSTVFFAFFFFVPLYGKAQQKPKIPKTVPELQRAIEAILTETKTPAAGVALVQGDSTVWVAGLGEASLEKRVKATENTMFRIGSVTKMFVSLAILKLQEEGRVSLKDKVRDRAPEIQFTNPWEQTHPILIEHLLEHTTGWDDMHLTEYALSDPTITLKQGLDYHPHSRISRWVPGTRMAYCNSGPPVAAYIVEKVTGQRFEDYIQQQFFGPMGMETMTFFASDRYQKQGATLYVDQKPQPYWHICVRPSGSINASPRDMVRMLRFFINRGRVDGKPLISEASLKRMETPSTSSGAKAGLEHGYGLANMSSPHNGFVYRSHSGGVTGGLTDFSYLPKHRLGYAVMINAGNADAILRIVDLIRNFQTRGLPTDSTRRSKGPTPTSLAGYYMPINPRMQMSYFLERIMNIQHLRSFNQFVFGRGMFGGSLETYVAAGDHQYASSKTGQISLVQVDDPLAGEVVHSGSLVLKRISPFLTFGQLGLCFIWLLYWLGSVLVGSIWFIRNWRKDRSAKSLLRWPFLASLCFLAFLILTTIGGKDPFESLGKVTFVSVSMMISSLLFALLAIWAVVTVVRERRAKVNPVLYWHATILSVLHLIVAVYLYAYGVIGIQTWQ